jgi:hypothetical protein
MILFTVSQRPIVNKVPSKSDLLLQVRTSFVCRHVTSLTHRNNYNETTTYTEIEKRKQKKPRKENCSDCPRTEFLAFENLVLRYVSPFLKHKRIHSPYMSGLNNSEKISQNLILNSVIYFCLWC